MKTEILPVLPLILLSIAVSSCTGPTTPPSSSGEQKTQTSAATTAKQTVPTESNAVVLTQSGYLPEILPGPEPVSIPYFFTNISDKALTVTSVEVVNITGSAFSLDLTSCLDVVLPPGGTDSCSVWVVDMRQGWDDEGQLILGIKEDNTVKTLRLPQIPRAPIEDAPAETNPPYETAPVDPPPPTPVPSPTAGFSPIGQ